ncbi:hypothetical protein EG68_02446 [Paragonimus skrjabini miyazakii]|uniref:Uncharacterized protein n=1 Tax=Paragonimus skrjabini miyazakii TaxID=59628 RepID=A0A8S9Z5E4_9TREM|nr:hypothetical protein EG68_02446 [Paragonimus skrjabini miyazakii]
MHSGRRHSSLSTVKQAERTFKQNDSSHVTPRSKHSESRKAEVAKTTKIERKKSQIPEAGDHDPSEEPSVLHVKHKQRTRSGENHSKRPPDENKPIRPAQAVTEKRMHQAEKKHRTQRRHGNSNDLTDEKNFEGKQHISHRTKNRHEERNQTEAFITTEQIRQNMGGRNEKLVNGSTREVESMYWHPSTKSKAETGLGVGLSSDLGHKLGKTFNLTQAPTTPELNIHCEDFDADQQGCAEDSEEYGSDFEAQNSGGSQLDPLPGQTTIVIKSESQTSGPPSLNYLWSCVTHQNVGQPLRPLGQSTGEPSTDAKQLIDFSRSFGPNVRQSGRRLLRRAKDLLKLIELEFDGAGHVFELKPLDGYANYMVRFGKANHCQVPVQTNDDALDREVQTDAIELCKGGGVWTQWPALDTGDCSGYAAIRIPIDRDVYGTDVPKSGLHDENPQSYMLSDLLNDFYPHDGPNRDVNDKYIEQSQRLNTHTIPSSASLLSKLRVVLRVLNEENVPDLNCLSVQNSELTKNLFHNTECANSPNGPDEQILNPGERVCISCHFAVCNGDKLLTIHLPKKLPPRNNLTNHCGFLRQAGEVIYVWSVSDGNSVPDFQLYCPGLSETGLQGANITDAIFSPDIDANMVVGGLADGSICLWDLRCSQFDSGTTKRPGRNSFANFVSHANWTPPIYTTSAIEIHQLHTDVPSRHASTEVTRGPTKAQTFRSLGHSAPIVGLQLTQRYDEPLESSFQFVALDTFGELSLWMVLKQLPGKTRSIYETLSGSQVDLGLRPGERSAQMIRLMYITIPTPYTDIFYSVFKSLVQEPPTDNVETDFISSVNMKNSKSHIMATTLAITTTGHFLVGFADGTIIQHSRSSGQVVYPRQFHRPASRAAVCSLVSHPERSLSIVLSGYADGMIRLYHTQQPQALCHWFTSDCRARLDPVVKLTWSHTVPSVFFSLDSSGSMLSWNILGGSQNYHPLCTLPDSVDVKNVDGLQSMIRDFSLSNGVLINMDGQIKSMTAFAFVYADTVKIHWFEPECTIHGSANDLACLRLCLLEWMSMS